MILPLTQMFVNLVSTGLYVSGNALPGRSEDYKAGGEVRTYGSGRQRAISVAGEQGTFDFQLRYVARSTVDTLRSWKQQLVQVRDGRSRRFYGVYFSSSIDEVPAAMGTWCVTDFDAFGAWHVSITLNTVDFNEAV